MPTTVSTPDQLHERVTSVAESAGVPNFQLSTRLTVDGAKLYASVMCYREAEAQTLVSALRREATAEFGEQGSQLTARREGPHVHVFLPLPKPDGQRGAQFLSSAFSTPKTEF
jgi:hypothetical protein